jgi:hypothetical protein
MLDVFPGAWMPSGENWSKHSSRSRWKITDGLSHVSGLLAGELKRAKKGE